MLLYPLSQVAGECYTVVEVGQVSLFVLALSTSVRSCTFFSNLSATYVPDYEKMTDALQCISG